MATIEDVVNRIVEQTQLGYMMWTPCGWGDDGEVNYWIESWSNCSFATDAGNGSARLLVHSPGLTGSVVLGEGGPVDSLIEVLQVEYDRKQTTKEEALDFVLDDLTKRPQATLKVDWPRQQVDDG